MLRSRPLVGILAFALWAGLNTIDEKPLPSPPGPSPIAHARQLVTVVADDWRVQHATLRRFERAADGAWRAIGEAIDVHLGRAGLGWGRGLHEPQRSGPAAAEGDERSPAGAFALGPAFGYATPAAAHLRLPYIWEVPATECVDDVDSAHYNQIVDRRVVASADWTSSEHMADAGDAYEWGVVVQQNQPPVKGAGSCIFLHVWSGSGGTAGCTGLDRDEMVRLLRWLDPAAQPALVQLPRAEYRRLQQPWDLPALEY